MLPWDGWVDVEHCVVPLDAGAATPAWKVAGADTAGVSFLPGDGLDDLPPCELKRVDPALLPAIEELVGHGGPAPPSSFDGPSPFVRWLGKRAHLGALAVASPTLWLDRGERIVKVTFRLTSSRVGVGAMHGGRLLHGGSTDRKRHLVTVGTEHARIDCWQRHSLPCGSDWHGRFPGGDVTPLAWLRLTYELHTDGRAGAWWASSFLPSAWFYRDWLRMARRDIVDASIVEAEAMLRPQPDVATGTRWARLDTGLGCVSAVA